jgi:hypothetical protein
MLNSKKNFEAKIEHIGENLRLAYVHLKIHEEMTKELTKRLDSYPKFFSLSRMAHYEVGILRLARAYDRNKHSLGLLKIVNMFQSQYDDWDLENIADATSLNREIEEDKNFLQYDSLIQELQHLRDKLIAHTDNKVYPRKLSFSIEEIYGDKLILKENRLTTKEIENLPVDKRDQLLMQKNHELFQAMRDDETKVLNQKIPSFLELYKLTQQGVNICNRYMMKLGIDLINLQLEEMAILEL